MGVGNPGVLLSLKYIKGRQNILADFLSRYPIKIESFAVEVQGNYGEYQDVVGLASIRSSAYHPSSNGMVERLNRTLITSLKKKLLEEKKD